MLWRRSASLISRMRMSFDIASSILRKFSAWRSRAEANSIFAIFVRPSTRKATSVAEEALELLVGGEGVLDGVVQQPGDDAHLVDAHLDEESGHFERMDQVGLAGEALLPLVDLALSRRRRAAGARGRRPGSYSSTRSAMSLKRSIETLLSPCESSAWRALPDARAASDRARAKPGPRDPTGVAALVTARPVTAPPKRARASATPRRRRSPASPPARSLRMTSSTAATQRLEIVVHDRVVEERRWPRARTPRQPQAVARSAPSNRCRDRRRRARSAAQRRRQQEDEAGVRAPFVHLPRALHLDLEHHVPARGQRRIDELPELVP